MSHHQHKVPGTISTTPTPSQQPSNIIPILLSRSRLDYSPANSAAHSSSISSLGLVEENGYNRSSNHYHNSHGLHLLDSSSNSSSAQDDDEDDEDELVAVVDRDINMIRNDTSKFDRSNLLLRRSFEEVFKMDNLASPVSNRLKLIFSSDDEQQQQQQQILKNNTTNKNVIANISRKSKSPNVFFKKFMSKSVLKPQSRSFKRVTRDLLQESQPLQSEINNEAAVTLMLKDEEQILEKRFFSTRNNNLVNDENLKKYELINRANKLWNHTYQHKSNNNNNNNNNENGMEVNDDKCGFISESNMITSTGSIITEFNNSRKRKSIDMNNYEMMDQSLMIKRRVVSTSPNLSGSTSPLIPITSRHNAKLMQSTSDELEKMSL